MCPRLSCLPQLPAFSSTHHPQNLVRLREVLPKVTPKVTPPYLGCDLAPELESPDLASPWAGYYSLEGPGWYGDLLCLLSHHNSTMRRGPIQQVPILCRFCARPWEVSRLWSLSLTEPSI